MREQNILDAAWLLLPGRLICCILDGGLINVGGNEHVELSVVSNLDVTVVEMVCATNR